MRMSTLLNEVREIEEKLLSERVTSTAFRKKTARVNPNVFIIVSFIMLPYI